jgi:hypothetical protein
MFDHKSAKEDIRNFGDWHWQLCQYLTAVDEGFGSELNQITDDPGKQLPMDSASAETRHRSTELCSLLASLVRNRAVSVARAIPNSDGYEALRQFILNLKPTTHTRGLALLSAITSAITGKPLLSQLIKLEEMFEETRKSGTPVQAELKAAIVLTGISGPLTTQLNLMLDGSAKYADVRDQILRWDRSQQKWTGLVISSDDQTGAISNVSSVVKLDILQRTVCQKCGLCRIPIKFRVHLPLQLAPQPMPAIPSSSLSRMCRCLKLSYLPFWQSECLNRFPADGV